MALKYPDILENNNPNYALIDDSQLRGGAVAVIDKAARNAIPADKRKTGMIVSYGSADSSVTQKYISLDLSDSAWINNSNWTDIGSSSGQEIIELTWSQLIDNNTNGLVKIWDRYYITNQNNKPLEIVQQDNMGEFWFVITNELGAQTLYKLPKNIRVNNTSNLHPVLQARLNN